jgi:hypothetical protein
MNFLTTSGDVPMAIDGLRGRTALITGGSRGIGAAISRRPLSVQARENRSETRAAELLLGTSELSAWRIYAEQE